MHSTVVLRAICSTAYTGVNTKSSLVGLRFVLGLVEAGYFVCPSNPV
jgi:hypothetical protein